MASVCWKIDDVAEIEVEHDGVGARKPKTVLEVFENTVSKYGDGPALCYMDKQLIWRFYSWRQYYEKCRTFAKALISIGVEPFDVVNVLGYNCPEWFFVNCGTIFAGAVIAGIYTTSGPNACHYISNQSKAKVVVLEDRTQLNKYLEMAHRLPHLKAIVMWGDEVPDYVQCPVPIYSLHNFLQFGAMVEDIDLQQRMEGQLPGHCCTLIYTSGTTGPPKGVMISHDNLTWTASSILGLAKDVTSNKERSVSFLPLSHVAAQLLDIHVPMSLGSRVSFASRDALKGALVDTLKEIKPTFFFGVPRVWEKIMERMHEVGQETKGLKKSLASWARTHGSAHTQSLQYGGGEKKSLGFLLANSMVLKKVKEELGLECCKLCFSGAAPISVDVISFFGSLDIPVLEIFGQSECTGPHSINMPGKWKIGSIGNPMPATRTRIDHKTGEIQYKGRHVCMGYLNEEKMTREILRDGWLHSGDMGVFDDDGFLSLTGRIKEILVTRGGENVPPATIEDTIKHEMPALSNVMVVGDNRKYLTFLCTLRVRLDSDGWPSDRLAQPALDVARDIGSKAMTVQEALHCNKFHMYIEAGMRRANEHATSRAQRVQKFTLLDRDFSIEGGELTPTLKLKRPVIAEMYAKDIEAMYMD